MKGKRLIHSVAMLFLRSGRKRAAWLKKHHVLGDIGENCYWGPVIIPVYPELIKLHNNVIVHGKSLLRKVERRDADPSPTESLHSSRG
jgi:hypothetical protein